ncbi:MAG TPA: DUF2860 family protein [Kiritimatiellia bacterium]|nr:DUF2860 family protein [Kiritimatiellia bacterium]HMP00381.1 DUF2860 family protein [Kiritimatiellia bacterium]
MKMKAIGFTLMIASAAVYAIEPLPLEEGLRGYVAPSVSVMSFRDNTLAGSKGLEIGNKRIDSLAERADEETAGSVSLAMEVGYMFLDQGVYVYLGNRLEDYLRLDNSSELGARMDLGNLGILDAGVMFSPVATEVWEDPFLAGADRTETDRTSAGGRIGLANILGTALEIHFAARSVSIDNERSGESLGLSVSDRALLAREGESVDVELLYTLKIDDQNTLIPSIKYGVYDADGAAMTRDGFTIQLTHAFSYERYRLISNLGFRQTEFDEKNPVFNEKQDEDEFIISLTGIYNQFMGYDEWSLTAGLLYAKRDSDIKFYESESFVASLGVMYFF